MTKMENTTTAAAAAAITNNYCEIGRFGHLFLLLSFVSSFIFIMIFFLGGRTIEWDDKEIYNNNEKTTSRTESEKNQMKSQSMNGELNGKNA